MSSLTPDVGKDASPPTWERRLTPDVGKDASPPTWGKTPHPRPLSQKQERGEKKWAMGDRR